MRRQNAEIVAIERYGTVGCYCSILYTRRDDERVVRADGLLAIFGRKQAILDIVIVTEFQRVSVFAFN